MASRSGIAAAAALLCFLAYYDSVTALTEEQIALVQQLHNACVQETGVDEALIANCKTGNFAEDPKLKCYMKCILSQIAVIDDDGVLDGEAMIAMLPEEFAADAPPIVRKCVAAKGADACDTAFLFNKCLQNADPAKYMLI